MKKTSKFTFIVFLIGASLLTACGWAAASTAEVITPSATPYIAHTPTPVPLSPTIIPSPYNVPKWELSTANSNFALFVLDYETLQIKAAYLDVLKPCGPTDNLIHDEVLITQAINVIGNPDVRFSFQHVGNFALLKLGSSNVYGAVILDPCTGQILFAGNGGDFGIGQIYPVHPIEPDALEKVNGPIVQPVRIDAISNTSMYSIEGFDAAWDSIQSFNLVHDFAINPYSVLVYLHGPTDYPIKPTEMEWLIFLQFGHYDIN